MANLKSVEVLVAPTGIDRNKEDLKSGAVNERLLGFETVLVDRKYVVVLRPTWVGWSFEVSMVGLKLLGLQRKFIGLSRILWLNP